MQTSRCGAMTWNESPQLETPFWIPAMRGRSHTAAGPLSIRVCGLERRTWPASSFCVAALTAWSLWKPSNSVYDATISSICTTKNCKSVHPRYTLVPSLTAVAARLGLKAQRCDRCLQHIQGLYTAAFVLAKEHSYTFQLS